MGGLGPVLICLTDPRVLVHLLLMRRLSAGYSTGQGLEFGCRIGGYYMSPSKRVAWKVLEVTQSLNGESGILFMVDSMLSNKCRRYRQARKQPVRSLLECLLQ